MGTRAQKIIYHYSGTGALMTAGALPGEPLSQGEIHLWAEWLSEKGVYDPLQADGGRILRNWGNESVVEDIKVEEAVPLPEITTPAEPLIAAVNILIKPPTPPLPCVSGQEPWCWVAKKIAPKIDFSAIGKRIPNAKVDISSRKISGKIQMEFKNKSKEGEEWEENKKTRQTRNHKKIAGSADLAGTAKELIYSRESNARGEKILDIKQSINKTKPNYKVTMEASWSKKGITKVIKALLEIFLAGSIRIDERLDVTVKHTFDGQTKSKRKKFKIKSRIPVDDVDWSW